MKGSSRLKAVDERTSHVTKWKATQQTNESSEQTNEQDNIWMNEPAAREIVFTWEMNSFTFISSIV